MAVNPKLIRNNFVQHTLYEVIREKTKIGSRLSAVVITILATFVLSNLSIIPTDAPSYDIVWSYLVPIAIPLLLFKANLRRIIKDVITSYSIHYTKLYEIILCPRRRCICYKNNAKSQSEYILENTVLPFFIFIAKKHGIYW